MKMTC